MTRNHRLAFPLLMTSTILGAVLPGCGNIAEQGGSTSASPSDESSATSANEVSAGTGGDSTSHPITVSRETTFVDGHLDQTGHVDFVAALNALTDPMVAPEENAAVALCRVMGSGQPDQASHVLFLTAIGADSLPTGETGALAEPAGASDAFIEQQSQAVTRPWTPDEFPQVAVWVEQISSDLDRCIEAVERPAFFLPLVDTLDPEDELPPLMSVLMPIVQGCRGVSRGLAARAMQRIAKGDEAGTRRDILAMYRLARHLSNGPVSIQSLVGVVIEYQANACTVQLLNSGLLNNQSARGWITALESLPDFKPSVETLETGERLTALDLVQAIKVRGPQSLSFLMTVNNDRLDRSAVDWNTALRTVNDWFDQIVKAVRTDDYSARLDAIAQVEQRLQSGTKGGVDGMARVLSGSTADPQATGKRLGNLVAALTIPAATQVHIADTRRQMQTSSTLLALELLRHHAENGEFPDALDGLDGDVPSDLFTASPLRYQRDDASVTVYSLGPNRIDDGGPNPDAGSDDIGFVLNAPSN